MALRRAFLQKVSSSPYGPELITNGNFDSDASGWSAYTGTATIVYDSGKGKMTGSGAVGQQIPIVNGETYQIKWKLSKIGGLSIRVAIWMASSIGSAAYFNSGYETTEGEFTYSFTASETNPVAYFQLYISSISNDLNVDNISFRKIL